MSNEDTLPDEDDAPWLDCMDGFKASIEDDEDEEPPVPCSENENDYPSHN